MRRRGLGLIIAAALFAALTARGFAAEPVHFTALDKTVVYAEAAAAVEPARGVILLFHQAGSSHDEYATIAPRLNRLGWATLAVDQRSGGDLFGTPNRTAIAYGRTASYEAAFPDLEASLGFARQRWPGRRILAWGSSYSASLVFILAARHPGELAGLLSFSPGEYFSGLSVAKAAANVTIPVYVTGASGGDEVAAAREIVSGITSGTVTIHQPQSGLHGSSTLIEQRNPAGAAENWRSVERFLAEVSPTP